MKKKSQTCNHLKVYKMPLVSLLESKKKTGVLLARRERRGAFLVAVWPRAPDYMDPALDGWMNGRMEERDPHMDRDKQENKIIPNGATKFSMQHVSRGSHERDMTGRREEERGC